MKRFLIIFLVLSFLCVACGENAYIDGKQYKTKGILTMYEMDDNIEYQLILGNVIWAVLLIYTVVFPVYFFGFSMWEPIGVKGEVSSDV